MRVDFAALPTWRKASVAFGLATFLLLASTTTIKQLDVWASPRQAPSPGTGQVFALDWMHGSVRYVTATELNRFRFWNENIARLIGIPILLAFFSVISLKDLLQTARKDASSP
jgi:hypothetical protein